MGTWKKLISENSNGEIIIANAAASIEPAGTVTFDLVDATKDLQITQSGGSQWDPISSASIATKLYTDTKLPLAGGTLTGALVGTNMTLSSAISPMLMIVNESLDTNHTRIMIQQNNVEADPLDYDADLLFKFGAATKAHLGWDSEDEKFKINTDGSGNLGGADHFTIDSSGDITISGTLTASNLDNLDNTSDANKPVSTATQTALNAKQDTITTGTSDNNIITVDEPESMSATDGKMARFTADGLEGISDSILLEQLGLNDGDGAVILNAASGEDASVTVNSAAFTPTSDNHIVAKHHLDTQLATKQASLTFGIANTNSVVVNSADVADDEYARFTATGLESRTAGEVKTDLGLDEYAAGAITRTGDFTIDATGDIIADVDGGQFTITQTTASFGNPDLEILSTHDDGSGPEIYIRHDSSSPVDDDVTGKINFQSKTDDDAYFSTGQVIASSEDVTHATPTGKLQLTTYTKALIGGYLKPGVQITGSNTTTDEVNVNIGNAATSTTTIAGHLTLPAANKLYLDGGTDTYITESDDDQLDFIANDIVKLRLNVGGATISYADDLRLLAEGGGSYAGTHSTAVQTKAQIDAAIEAYVEGDTFTSNMTYIFDSETASRTYFRDSDTTLTSNRWTGYDSDDDTVIGNTISIVTSNAVSGIIVPCDCTLTSVSWVGYQAWNADQRVHLQLWTGTVPHDTASGTTTATLRASTELIDYKRESYNFTEDLADADLDAGDMVYPAFQYVSGTTVQYYGSVVMYFKRR